MPSHSVSAVPSEVLEAHYTYEVDMLQGTYVYLADGKYAPDKVAEYALIESFCIHARALIEFFAEKKRAGKYADANYVKLRKDKEPWKTLYKKLSQQIAHLDSNDRTFDPSKKIGPSERNRLLTDLAKQSEEFNAKLRAEYRGLNVPTITQQVISTRNGATTTNSLSMNYQAGSLRR
jgi:hypothetical protein